MTKKLIAQAVALVRALDETGNVRGDKTLAFAVTDHA